jgi:hypothetical protein
LRRRGSCAHVHRFCKFARARPISSPFLRGDFGVFWPENHAGGRLFGVMWPKTPLGYGAALRSALSTDHETDACSSHCFGRRLRCAHAAAATNRRACCRFRVRRCRFRKCQPAVLLRSTRTAALMECIPCGMGETDAVVPVSRLLSEQRCAHVARSFYLSSTMEGGRGHRRGSQRQRRATKARARRVGGMFMPRKRSSSSSASDSGNSEAADNAGAGVGAPAVRAVPLPHPCLAASRLP